jgi:polyisoprenoid-binding protein YceI
MKARLLSGSLVSLALAWSLQLSAAPYQFDASDSTIKWVGKKIAGQHNGEVKLKEGSLDPQAKGEKGKFVIDLTTIESHDLKGQDEWKGKLEGHLKSADFFNVEKFPQAVLVLKELKPDAKDKTKYEAKGDLTIKGITKSITVPATIVEKDGKATVNSKFKINRLDWDIRYNSGKFFDPKQLGDKMISDDVEFEVQLNSKKI